VLESFLRRTTDTTWKSLGFGIVSTALMQSSSLVSVLTISFLSAGLIALSQGIGIIFGANLGTTTGAWLVAGLGLKVDIAAWALPMLVFGVIMFFQKGHARLQATGWLLVGLGFLFLGIGDYEGGLRDRQRPDRPGPIRGPRLQGTADLHGDRHCETWPCSPATPR